MSTRKTTESFIEESVKLHGNKYTYNKTKYKNNLCKVTITCSEHGDFDQIPFLHLQGSGCPKCGIVKRSNTRKSPIEEFIQKAKAIHGDKYDYSKVICDGYKNKVSIICPIHGEFNQRPNNHLNGQGCFHCGHINRTNFLKNTQEDFIKLSNKLHNNKYDYSNVVYINNNSNVIIGCPVHGNFEQTPRSHLSKKGCWKCKSSHGEKTLIKIFNKLNIEFINEYSLPFYNKLRYDFYLPKLNILIEFHGGQHFFPIEFFGGVDGFKGILERDAFKKSLAREYKIPIIYFTYKHLRMSKEDFEKFVIFVLKKFSLEDW